ncbi:Smr/MutS family protein [Entomomonas sp. E2T0]|uniref:Smr/MutS family protein n=1 Tax=Entomomonas sp. E2T0 TaxID=2930213 RepID=UPI0022282F28|nr:Smr/MutS family protein [Entomomonas sp. E2T0]UYZ82997.1 Smr/MutS family protein [Entomomonas sp. E2T0]
MAKDDDISLFRAEMKGVKPIKYDKADISKKTKDKLQIKTLKENAANTLTKENIIDGLSDQFVIDVEPEEFLYWANNGVQESQMRRLKAGQIPFAGSIDLHGLTVDQSRKLLWEFLDEATKLEIRCVRVTHGKALRKDKSKPIIKSYINTWLRQHPQILGFCSCQPKHGGTGAVYIILKRTMLEGRDE